MSAPSNEEIARVVAQARMLLQAAAEGRSIGNPGSRTAVIVTLADENDRLRAELDETRGLLADVIDAKRAECADVVELLERASASLRQGDEIIREEVEDSDLDEGYVHLADEIDAMASKLKDQT